MPDYEDPENTLIIALKDGEVALQLLPDVAPQHVERIKTLARDGQYDNVAFHRVIDGFMAQTGDVANANMEKAYNPSRAGTGGSSLPDLPAEFSKVPFDRGALGMARWNDLFAAGEDRQVRAGFPNGIERIEGGLLSYKSFFTDILSTSMW